MPSSRALLKNTAKETIRDAKPNVILVGAVYLLISIVLSALSSRITGANITMAKIQQYYEHIQNGDVDYALRLYENMMPSPGANLISLLLGFVSSIIGVGWLIFLLNTLRKSGASFGNLLDGFAFFWRILLLNIVVGLFVFLWSLLLIVPGIIAAYRYRMATYILIDNPDASIMECIRRSKQMMQGHKAELFWLDLSFLGWMLLTAIPYVGYLVQLWTIPYLDMTYSLFYESLRLADVQSGSAPLPGQSWGETSSWEDK